MADTRYRPYGGARELFIDRYQAILLHGPRGTGKTLAVLNKMFLALDQNPNSRGLLLRQTRESLTGSALETWESKVLGPGHPMLCNTEGKRLSRRSRTQYDFPNGSILTLGGLEDGAEKYKGSDLDIICISQCESVKYDAFQDLMPCLRNGKAKYHQLIMEANPSYSSHWLMNSPAIHTIKSTYQDNPLYWDHKADDWTDEGRRYVIGILDSLTGVAHKRHRLGLWVNAEGVVFHAFNPEPYPQGHIMDRKDLDLDKFKSFYGAIDWGFRHPCAILVVATDNDDNIYLIEEEYQTELTIGLIIPRLKKLQEKYKISTWVADSASPDNIKSCQNAGLPVVKCKKKDICHGVDLVNDLFANKRLFIYDPLNLGDIDHNLARVAKPTGLLQEVERYVWKDNGKNDKEEVVKKDDHSCFAAGTLISTPTGLKRIEELKPGNLIVTHLGIGVITQANSTGYRMVSTVNMNGTDTVVTNDHPYWVNGQYQPITKGRHSCVLDTNFTKARNSIAQTSPIATMSRLQTEVELKCTDMSGRMKEDLSQTECSSTTKTEIEQITTLVILGSCLQESIRECILSKELMSSLRIAANTIKAMLAENGILFKPIESGPRNNQSQNVARIVAQNLRLDIVEFPNSVATHVGPLQGASPELMILRDIASGVANLLQLIAILKRNVAPVVAPTTIDIFKDNQATEQEVFNLATSHGTYFANGVLVSNCDALRYICRWLDKDGGIIMADSQPATKVDLLNPQRPDVLQGPSADNPNIWASL